MTRTSTKPRPKPARKAKGRQQLLQEAERLDWPALLQQINDVRAEWDKAVGGLPERGDNGVRDGDWSLLDIRSHVAQSLLRRADALSLAAVAKAAEFKRTPRKIPGKPSPDKVQALTEKGWTDFAAAARTVAKQPERGPIIQTQSGRLSARQLVALGLEHVREHAGQIRGLRERGTKS